MTHGVAPADDGASGFEVFSVAACAEDAHQVQLEGGLPEDLALACPDLFAAAGWTVFRIGDNGSLIARLRREAMFILRPDCGFTLSRVPDLDAGLRLLEGVFGSLASKRL